jgi:hypothetical protein
MGGMGARSVKGVERFDQHWNAGELTEVILLHEASAETKADQISHKGRAGIHEHLSRCRRPPVPQVKNCAHGQDDFGRCETVVYPLATSQAGRRQHQSRTDCRHRQAARAR